MNVVVSGQLTFWQGLDTELIYQSDAILDWEMVSKIVHINCGCRERESVFRNVGDSFHSKCRFATFSHELALLRLLSLSSRKVEKSSIGTNSDVGSKPSSDLPQN